MNISRALIEARRFTDVAVKKLKTEPPIPPGSRYIRTHKLRGAWEPDVSFSDNIEIDITNDRDYAGWVQGRRFTGDRTQMPRFQKTGWVSLTDINRKVWPIYQIRIARALGIPLRSLRNLRF